MFSNCYGDDAHFAAAGALGDLAAMPLAWLPLAERRDMAGIEPIQFALLGNWTINDARDLAWNNCLLLWALRDDQVAHGLLLDTLAASTALASRMLLVAV